MAASIAGFGGWLAGEMHRAALARTRLGMAASSGACANLTSRDAEELDRGLLWCGAIAALRPPHE